MKSVASMNFEALYERLRILSELQRQIQQQEQQESDDSGIALCGQIC